IMTVRQALEMHDGATISLRGNLIEQHGNDRYSFRDKTDTIAVIIPAAVFDGREVKPDQMISINGSLDKKMTPPVVRVDRIQK
ncbi:NirD/YgiW/YdeI family stress tolerance protein, partial [Klebsiella michiganensis]